MALLSALDNDDAECLTQSLEAHMPHPLASPSVVPSVTGINTITRTLGWGLASHMTFEVAKFLNS
jgi:hypothetical protein